jgi:phosphocarrier protein
MKQFDYTIKDPLCIHARPAGMFSKLAKGFGDTVVTITKDGNTVKASQLMKVMAMGIKSGHTVTIAAEGPSEDEAIEAVRKFLEENL